jgi:hypothetical protein
MRFAVSVALVLLLLGMPLGCVLGACQLPAPCCPRPGTTVKCPYDALDAAKVANLAAIANVPVAVEAGTVPPSSSIDFISPPPVAEDRGDL